MVVISLALLLCGGYQRKRFRSSVAENRIQTHVWRLMNESRPYKLDIRDTRDQEACRSDSTGESTTEEKLV